MRNQLLLLAALFAAPLAAHDFWLEPGDFHPARDARLALTIRVGDEFAGEALPRDPALIKSFVTHGPADADGLTRRIVGLDGCDPAGWLRPKQDGLHWVALTTHPQRVELPSVRFDAYLMEEGLEAILRERAERSESRDPGRERFSRCAKTALLVGEGRGEGWTEAMGLQLELVLASDPARRKPGQPLGVRLLSGGQPVEGALVTAVRRGHTERVLSARSDRRGRVRLAINEPGDWLISAVHMQRDTEDDKSEWRSWWASLTFQL